MRYFVYMLASRSRNLYTGVTNNLMRRVQEHREGSGGGFAKRYRIHRLVYFETFRDVRVAIAREKQIKSWTRAKRVALIESKNRAWVDLGAEWFKPCRREKQIPRPSRRTRNDNKRRGRAKKTEG